MLFGVTIHNCIGNSAVMNIDNPLISDEFLINQLDLIIDEVILLNVYYVFFFSVKSLIKVLDFKNKHHVG